MITSNQPDVLKRKAKELDKKLEVLMAMYHKLSYAKVLRLGIESGVVKSTQKNIPHTDIVAAANPDTATEPTTETLAHVHV